jgi:hypothetical protein
MTYARIITVAVGYEQAVQKTKCGTGGIAGMLPEGRTQNDDTRIVNAAGSESSPS